MKRDDEACDAVLLGRDTFEAFRGFWPAQTDDTSGAHETLNRVHKYVYSSTLTDPEWEGSTILSGDLSGVVRELKNSAGADIVVTGSIQLTHALFASGLVDEIRLFTYPIVQGGGRRLFSDQGETPSLSLIEGRAFSSGVTYTAYRVS